MSVLRIARWFVAKTTVQGLHTGTIVSKQRQETTAGPLQGQAAQAWPALTRWRTQDSQGWHRGIIGLAHWHKGQDADAGPGSSSWGTPHQDSCSGAGTEAHWGWHMVTKAVMVQTQGQVAQAKPYLTRWCTAVAGPRGAPAPLLAPSGGSFAAGGHCRRSLE